MNNKKTLLGCFLLLLPVTVMAVGFSRALVEKNVDLGVFNLNQRLNQHVNITGLIGNNYLPESKSAENILLGVGVMKVMPSYGNIKFGANLFYFHKSNVSGVINVENTFPNLSYGYDVTHVPLLASIEASFKKNAKVTYAINAGFGPDLVITRSYKEQSLDGVSIPSNEFKGKSQISYAASLGVRTSFKQAVFQKSFSIGYKLFYLGRGNLTPTNSQILTDLSTGHGFAHSLMFSVTV